MALASNTILTLGTAPVAPVTPPPATNETAVLVQDGWSRSQNFADQAFTAAQSAIQQLSSLSFNIPDVNPVLNQLSLSIAQFNALLQTAPTIPANNFIFNDQVYSSNLLVSLRAQLATWVTGASTGLSPVVEQAIWDRARAREVVGAAQKQRESLRMGAMRGFVRPTGAMLTEALEAVQAGQNATSSQSRDVMIKQAELEQSNRRFSFEQAWRIEEGAMQYTTQQMQRALEAAKATQQFVIDTYQHTVNSYNAAVHAYEARVGAESTVFRANIDAQVAEANLRVEAAKVNVQKMIQTVTIIAESIKAGAQVSGQLAASALASINLSGGIHDSTSTSVSNSSSNSASIGFGANANYNYSGAIV